MADGYEVGSFDDKRSDTHYDGTTYTRMRELLALARQGTLESNWRESLTPSGRPKSTIDVTAEAAALVGLQNLPPAPWEPYQGPSWRVALDSWYFESRKVESVHYLARMSRLLERDPGNLDLYSSMALRGTFHEQHLEQLLTDAERYDTLIHDTIRLNTFVRAMLTASYLAGLAAGGDARGRDWCSWLRGLAEPWPEDHPGRGAAIATADSAAFSSLERLPAYWNPPARLDNSPQPR